MDTELNQEPHSDALERALVLPLHALDPTLLPLVGGKAANLGALIRAGLSVPAGFCLTTAAYAQMNDAPRLDPILEELAALPRGGGPRLEQLAANTRAALLQAPIPKHIITAIADTYQALAMGTAFPVAVRSSATAEDLPLASFAGQHDTSLNILGVEALLQAIQSCWASLWSDRAVRYRAELGIDPRDVRLAIVVQRMVDAQVAGVLFTANPLTGRRREAVIAANPGLGEAVVAGLTTPDHFVVNSATNTIVERRLGDKHVVIQAIADGGTRQVERAPQPDRPSLSDAQIHALTAMGVQVEKHMGAPQDIEWAIDATGQVWLLQARPITTLFPLPLDAPPTDSELRVYLSFTLQQGTAQPFTPIGISAIRLLASAITTFAGFPPPDPLAGPSFVTEAASRVFFDVTPALRHSFGRALLTRVLAQAEAHAATIFQQLINNPWLTLLPTSRARLIRTIGRALLRTRLPYSLLLALLWPATVRRRFLRLMRLLHTADPALTSTDARMRLAMVEQRIADATPRLLSAAAPAMLSGMATFSLAARLLGDLASDDECQALLRGLPDNPTTEMNRALWALAQRVQAEPAVASLVRATPAAQLAAAYRQEQLPACLQQGLADFLAQYGHRSVAELDLGVPRWSEDPTYLLGVLVSYLQRDASSDSPERQFQRAARAAEAMVAELTRRAQRKSCARGLLVGFLLRRARALGGLREMPRFCLALLLADLRTLLQPIGEELAQQGRLEAADDVFFLSLPDLRGGLDGKDLRAIVRERRACVAQERLRRQVPLVLLSDGTSPVVEAPLSASAHATLQGLGAAPGRITALARVVRDPHDSELAPGEILVASATDPGWTPLFLTAGGLVMEFGGVMAHGAIVAREYGIPAVVGVLGATERIASGSRITVDGSAGTVSIESTADA